MTDPTPRPTPVETRFALVLNGGVSLAVWMSGVVHELNRLRLASAAPRLPLDAKERRVADAWRAILDHTGHAVVVDTVAGTSAGGLNGTLLATAVARGADLPDLRTTWLDLASLERGVLLRDDPTDAVSVLRGDFFTREVHKVVRKVRAGTGADPAECTLLVTATAVGATPRGYEVEGRDRPAYVADSRRVYRFRRQQAADGSLDHDDFTEAPRPDGEPGAIALAARASAGFPVAFAPVWEQPWLRERSRDLRAAGSESFLIDGGVLDNAPFEPLLDALRDRSVSAPFQRVVLYVTPSERRPGDAWGAGDAPDVGRVAGAVVGAVREPDQRVDMDVLERLFDRAAHSQASPHHVLAGLLTGAPPLRVEVARASAGALFPLYRARRLEEAERWLCRVGEGPALVPAPDLELGGAAFPVVPTDDELIPGRWTWGLPAAARVLRWWGRAIVLAHADQPAVDAVFPVLDRAQRRVRTLRALEDAGIADRVRPGTTPEQRLAALCAVHDELDCAGEVDALLRSVATAVAEAVPDAVPDGGSAADLAQFAVDVEILATAMATDAGDRPRVRYRQVDPSVAPLVQTDYDRMDDWPTRKLYGERWGHFGAFATRDGRAYDWLWGRLDGAAALCHYLLGDGFADDPRAQALATAILKAEDTDRGRLDVASTRAYWVEPDQLLVDLARHDPHGHADAIELLIDTVPEVLGQVDRLGPWLESITAQDPTLDRGLGLRRRLLLKLVHAYTAPPRVLGLAAARLRWRRPDEER